MCKSEHFMSAIWSFSDIYQSTYKVEEIQSDTIDTVHSVGLHDSNFTLKCSSPSIPLLDLPR